MRKMVVGCGYLGRRVAMKWAEAGDEVFAMTRSPERAAEIKNQGWHPILADVTKPETLTDLPEV
ncbi:MAG: NAD-binding protein, partial [Planctomycetaceae bacterium]|nr:NAD-binding protein [Planctomycetaceae bacterium]